jgi:aspartate/methionine/tyrosine aminotransferase
VLINPNNPTGAVCSRRCWKRRRIGAPQRFVIFADDLRQSLLDDDTQYPSPPPLPTCPSSRLRTIEKHLHQLAHRLGIVSGDAAAREAVASGACTRLCDLSNGTPLRRLEGPQDH